MDANGREQDAQDANQDANGTQTASGRWCSVAEAAAALGLQPRAVQKRVQGDRLRSRHDGRRLLVWIEEAGTGEGEQSNQQDANRTRPTPEVREPDASNDGGPLVEQLRSEVTFLRNQLDARTSAEAEFRRLLLYSQERERADRREIEGLRAITASTPEAVDILEEITVPEQIRQDQKLGDMVAATSAIRAWWKRIRRGNQ